MTTTAREQLVQRLGVVEETTVGDPVLDALELRVQRLAPEVLGNDEAAVFELAEVESAIAQHKKRQALDALASVEMASRVRIAAEQEAAAQRVEWQSELQAIEQITDAALLKFERQITGALEAAADALEAHGASYSLSSRLEQKPRNLSKAIESRLLRRTYEVLGQYGIRPDLLSRHEGNEPLAVPPVKKAKAREAVESNTE